MASGGYQPNKPGKSEPRRQSNWQQSVSSDRDDVQSLNSLLSDMRINNWDLSDLRPSNLGGDSKRRKKSKGNPEREREQSLSVDLPPRNKKHHTASSYPQKKNSSSVSKPHRSAAENLKPYTTFSDLEGQMSSDGERNNERQASQSRRRLRNASLNKTDSEDDAAGTRERLVNRNNNMDYTAREQGPDSNEIVAHLMQIRDFTKQARSMLESMEKLGDRKKSEDIEKLRRLIRNLQEQEQGYRGLLQNTLAHRDNGKEETGRGEDGAVMKMEGKYDSDDDTSVDLEVRTEESETTENSQDSRPRIESKLGIGSDVDNDDNDDGADDQYRMPTQWTAGNSSGNTSSSRAVDLENTLTQGQAGHLGIPVQESEEGARGSSAVDGEPPTPQHQELLRILKEKQEQLRALVSRQEELNVKRQETEKKLLEAQIRDNKAREALAAVAFGQQFAEHRLAALQAAAADPELGTPAWEISADGNDGGGEGAVGEERQLKSNIVGYPESDDEDNSKVREVDSLPSELLELRRQLNYLRNEFSQVAEAPKNVESEARSSLTEGREQLQNKIQELQNKKSHMDRLLQELQRLHSQPLDNLRNNETNPQDGSVLASTPVSSNIPAAQSHQPQQKLSARAALSAASVYPGLPSSNPRTQTNEMTAPAAAPSTAVDKAIATFTNLSRGGSNGEVAASGETMDPEVVMEVEEKLKRLKEVRGQLEQLRSLVQYYQGQKDEMETAANWANQPGLPGFSETSLRRQADPEARGSHSSLQQQQQQQHQQEILRLHMQQLQQRDQGKENGTNASSSIQNMVQLPNLAGADHGGDELSDEDNASVSQSESQWSHLGPWDDDPEIQEKVRKLKAAKEKLRQLQDLVAFVQQSPDAARSLPDNQGDTAASVEGETVSHATQTDEPNVSVSEGEVTSETMRMPPAKNGSPGRESPRTELERLRKERTMLLEIQNQLKNMQNQVQKTTISERGDYKERLAPPSDLGKSDMENNPSGTVVTFASNDELYSKMRRQRILREELRSKKKELEAIMKKDRNKRQYSRNQDNQSDTVSLNTDTFGIPASIDATMATWGGSTVDNLENITEDEDRQERNGDEDDGYPSDMALRVGEEEDENDSNDGTYTVEQVAGQRKILRKGANTDMGARPKTSRGRQGYALTSNREKNMKKPSRKQISSRNSDRDGQRHARSRQEDFGSATENRQEDRASSGQDYEWFRAIEDKLSGLSNSVEALLKKSDSESRQLNVSLSQETPAQASSLMSPMQEQILHLQNQSIMLSFGQLVQTFSHQQGDIQHLQQQVQALHLQVQEILSNQSFHISSAPGAGQHHLMPPALSKPSRNSYNLQTTAAAVDTHAFTISHQQMPSPFSQSSLNSTAPAGLFHELSSTSQGLHSFQPAGHALSTSNLSLGLDTQAAAAGSTGLGTSLTVNTGSSLSLPQQGPRPGFSPLGQSTSSLQHFQHHHLPPQLSSAHPTSSNIHNTNFSTSSNQQFQTNLSSRYPFISSQVEDSFGMEHEGHPFISSQVEDSFGMEHEGQVSGLSSHLLEGRTKNRKSDSEATKSENDAMSGMKMSTPKVGSFPSQDDGGSSVGPRWEKETTYPDYRSLSAGVDGGITRVSGFLGGAASSSQPSMQSIKNQHSKIHRDHTQVKSSDATEGNTLFDALRDTIYAEVANVISQNESRPHFLLKLFRDMQQIDSDFMRQRTLFSLQELVRSSVKDSSAASPSSHSWSKATANTADTGGSEQTPSESITSEDDDDMKLNRLQEEIRAAERSQLDRWARNGSARSFPFDYSETAENPSSLSTPTNADEESQFFKKSGQAGTRSSEQLPKDLRSSRPRGRRKLRKGAGSEGGSVSSELARFPAMDQVSRGTFSDLPYAHVDMNRLDQQIKNIMMETIPLVKRHMEDMCSKQLLSYIKRLVLSLTSQSDDGHSAKFFQQQLSSVIENTLHKYEGRRMRDCGEDLLVEVSDVLFNELAYYNLMEDLGDSAVTEKSEQVDWNLKAENSSAYTPSSSILGDSDDDDEDKDENSAGRHEDAGSNDRPEKSYTRSGHQATESKQDRIGKDGDGDLTSEVGGQDSGEKNKEESEQKYKIELAPSETKPFTRIGSDEDDDEGDEEMSMDDPSETAVSRDSMMEVSVQRDHGPPLSIRPETEGGQEDGAEKQDPEKPESPKRARQAGHMKPQEDGDGAHVQSIDGMSASVAGGVQMNGTINGENNNISDEEVTINDLPERLTVPAAEPNSGASSSTPELKSK